MKFNSYAALAALLLFQFAPAFSQKAAAQTQKPFDPTQVEPVQNQPAAPLTGYPAQQVRYFQKLREGAGGANTAERNSDMWREIEANFPAENEPEAHPDDWGQLFDIGALNEGHKYSGRCLDAEITATYLRVLSASGGLWHYQFSDGQLTCLSDKLNSNWGGAFASNPTNPDIIYLGTGEPGIHAGTGLWKTVNGGKSWSKMPLTPTPNVFYKILVHPSIPNTVFAATDLGLFRTTNNGLSWTRVRGGIVTDVVLKQELFAITLLCSVKGLRFFRSINNGANWSALNGGGVPNSNIGRTEFAVTPADPNVVYANVARNDNNQTRGIYKSINFGSNWVVCPPFGTDFHGGNGNYNCAIAASPTDANLVLAGGYELLRTTDGNNFSAVLDAGHKQIQDIAFYPTHPGWVLAMHDGGYAKSENNGTNFLSDGNNLPVAQFYHFAVGKIDENFMGGGTQSNGLFYTKSPGYEWNALWPRLGNNGYGFAVSQLDPLRMIGVTDSMGGTIPLNFRTEDGGENWTRGDFGITLGPSDKPVVRAAPNSLSVYWTERDKRVYQSYNGGFDWYNFSPNGDTFLVDVKDLSVGQNNGGLANVYACLWDNKTVWVRDNVTLNWENRSAGLPTTGTTGTYIRKVAPSLKSTERDVAYAVMGGMPNGTPKKVYKTINRGLTWTDITGNLPNVACTDLIPYPDDPNILILGTEVGVFRTDDGGANWRIWWEGMPRSAAITELDFLDHLSGDGKFYVYAATFGRGVFRREIGAGFAPKPSTEIGQRAENQALETPHFGLGQNRWAVGDAGLTTVPFFVATEAQVNLSLFNEAGQLVKTLLDENTAAGEHHLEFRVDALAAGAYFYTMTAPGFLESKKMVVAH